jgi:hypothetical protein
VEGNDKYWARVKVLSRLVEILSAELGYQPADPLKRRSATKAVKPATDGKAKPKRNPQTAHKGK